MSATLRLTSALKMYLDGKEEVAVEAGCSVRETLIGLKIKPELIALVVVDGEQKTKEYIIKDGDTVKVMAIIGGG
jgi:sulfur carrier protein ThiS